MMKNDDNVGVFENMEKEKKQRSKEGSWVLGTWLLMILE